MVLHDGVVIMQVFSNEIKQIVRVYQNAPRIEVENKIGIIRGGTNFMTRKEVIFHSLHQNDLPCRSF